MNSTYFNSTRNQNFCLNCQFHFFGQKLIKKGTSRRKRKEWTSPMNSAHSNYSTLTSFEFWDHIFPKRVFLVQNRQSSYHNWILHIRLRLGSKFQLKMTILIFWKKFAQNWFSKKLHFCLCPWSLLTLLTLFARWPTDTTTLQCLFS